MKILFLTNLLPYPLDNGGKMKTYTTLKALKEGGHYVDLLCFKENDDSYKSEEGELLNVCNSINQVFQRLTTANNKNFMVKMALKSLFSTIPLSSYKFVSKDMQAEIRSKKQINYDCVYYDHLPLFVYNSLCRELWPNARYVLDEHNCEATIMRRNADTAKNLVKKTFMKYEAAKVGRFESKALLSVDRTIVLTEEDYKTLRDTAGKDFVYSIIPIGVQDKGVKKCSDNGECLNILFVGTLTWEPNNQGLIWFIDNVIPLLETEGFKYHFYIVGKNPSSEVIEKTKDNTNITVTGYVESVNEYYDKCDCTVVPLFIGSGQRVKLIEAFSKGMPSISTSIGAEGLKCVNGKDIIIADNPEQFFSSLIKITNRKVRASVSMNCRKLYEDEYSFNSIKKSIVTAIS